MKRSLSSSPLLALIVCSIVGCAVGMSPEPGSGGGNVAPEGDDTGTDLASQESIVAEAGSSSKASDASSPSEGGTKDAGTKDSAASPEAAPPQSTTTCPGYALPDETAPCKACTPGSGNCQDNGCYGGYYCDLSGPKCRPKPSGC